MPKLADAEVVLHGLIIALVERTDFETKELTGYRATVVGSSGGAAVVNFDLKTALPFAPLMSQVVWRVVSAPWSMGESGSGMSTKFVGVVDQTYLMDLMGVLEENDARHPEKAAAK